MTVADPIQGARLSIVFFLSIRKTITELMNAGIADMNSTKFPPTVPKGKFAKGYPNIVYNGEGYLISMNFAPYKREYESLP